MKITAWKLPLLALLAALACLFGDQASAALWGDCPPWAAPLGVGTAMLVNAANITGMFTNLRTTFNKAFEGLPAQWQRVAMLVPSSTITEEYDWLSDFPMLREWLGDKVVSALSAHGYSIRNKEFEATVGVKRIDIETDRLGLYEPRVRDVAWAARVWPDRLVAALQNGAFAAPCYDGQYFYDTDHPVGGATQSNAGTAVLSATTLAAAVASYGAGRLSIQGRTNEHGENLDLDPDVLEVPPALEATGKILLTSDKLVDDSPNPYKGTAELRVNRRLTSATAWFLHVTNRPIKPFVFQQRKAPHFVSQTDMGADDVFMRAMYKMGVEASGNAGYGLWQLSYGSTGGG